MKLKINRLKLIEIFENLNFAIDKKKNLPNLLNYKITVSTDQIIFEATNNEIAIKQILKTDFEATVSEDNVFVINAKLIYDIITKLETEEINLDIVEKNILTIVSEHNKYNLNCYLIEMFPHISIEEEGHLIELSAENFTNLLSKVSYATSESDIRPILKGINVSINNDLVEVIGTDNYRVANAIFKNNEQIDDQIVVDIPQKSTLTILNLLKRNEISNFKLYFANNTIIISLNNGEILFKTMLLTGVYPNLNKVINASYNSSIELNPVELLHSIDRINVFATDTTKIASLTIDNSLLIIQTVESELGSAKEQIKVVNHGKILKNIIINIKQLKDLLKTVEENKITMEYESKEQPLKFVENSTIKASHFIFPLKR